MEFSRINTEETIVIKLNGRLDKYTSPLLENEIIETIPELGDKKLEINMEDVIYLSSAGLRVLLNTHKGLKDKLIVTHVRTEIKEVFEITGFDKVLTIN